MLKMMRKLHRWENNGNRGKNRQASLFASESKRNLIFVPAFWLHARWAIYNARQPERIRKLRRRCVRHRQTATSKAGAALGAR